MKQIFLAGGCFWGTEHYIRQLEGVIDTAVGYANGSIPSPTYQQVYTDATGHVECVRVTYDPEVISLQTLCRLYFRSIDPLLLNRQGDDVGTRYRTGIYWQDENDRREVESVYADVEAAVGMPLVVEKGPLECFYPAEDYHQDYLIRNTDGYCHLSLDTLGLARNHGHISRSLRSLSTEEKRMVLPTFFKTGKGEYGEGDRFIGVAVPDIRRVAKEYSRSSYDLIEALLESEWHEMRMCALLMLVDRFRNEPDEVLAFYLTHTAGIDNWDLVDLSAPYILGKYLLDKEDRSILYRLAASPVMWEQRIAMVSTLTLIRNGQSEDTIRLAESFLGTEHDLMRKATGWMLREVGKRDVALLHDFLEAHRHEMPRVMLRYAIERLPEACRKHYMKRD